MARKIEVIGEEIQVVKHTILAPGFIDVTDADPVALAMLSADVAKANGEVDVLVHPFTQQESDPFPLTAEYQSAVVELIEEGQAVSRPLIVFEEIGRIEELPQTLPSTETIYVVQTLDADPAPVPSFFFTPDHIYEYPSRQERNAAMVGLIDEFKNAGVSKARIGGRYLVNMLSNQTSEGEKRFGIFERYTSGVPGARAWIDRSMFPDGCVGITIYGFLHRGVGVAVSSAASPTNAIEPTFVNSQL